MSGAPVRGSVWWQDIVTVIATVLALELLSGFVGKSVALWIAGLLLIAAIGFLWHDGRDGQ